MRILASVIFIAALLALANFVQALAVGVSFGTGSWSNVHVAVDLATRWLAFALAAFIGASVARDRASLVAVIAGAAGLIFGLGTMLSSPAAPELHNYLSLAVLVSGPALGALAWNAFHSARRESVA
jgi:hypothetical protein